MDKMKTATALHAGEDVKKLGSTYILLVRMENGIATLENGLSVSYKTKYFIGNCTLVHLFQKKKRKLLFQTSN